MTITDRPLTQETRPQSPVTPRSRLPQLIGGSVVVLIGFLWLLERLGVVDLSVTAVLGLATFVVGMSLMVLSRRGTHVGLMIFGTILAMITLATAAAPFEGFQGGVGDRTIEVASVDDIAADYNLAMGKLTIDLRDIDNIVVPTAVNASVGIGELTVRVPPDTPVEIEARVGAGQVEIFGRVIDGIGVDESYVSPGLEPSDDRLTLQLEVFTGRVEVTDE